MSGNPAQTPVAREFRARMEVATTNFAVTLEQVPGWLEFRRSRMGHTLSFAIAPMTKPEISNFPSPLDDQHQVVMLYLGLAQTLHALQDCEFYFRRFPFKALPISRYTYATNVCEMYFGRFYEFKERMKKLLNAAKLVAEGKDLLVGPFIKAFENDFDSELRARNCIHHHGRFDDVAIDRLFISESFVKTSPATVGRRSICVLGVNSRKNGRQGCEIDPDVSKSTWNGWLRSLTAVPFPGWTQEAPLNEVVPESTPVALASDYSLATGA